MLVTSTRYMHTVTYIQCLHSIVKKKKQICLLVAARNAAKPNEPKTRHQKLKQKKKEIPREHLIIHFSSRAVPCCFARVRYPLQARYTTPPPAILPNLGGLICIPTTSACVSTMATTTDKADSTKSQNKNTKTGRELASCTVRSPPFAYAHLSAVTEPGPGQGPGPGSAMDLDAGLDALQVRAYCTSALRQFLGDTGAAVSVDILALDSTDCWVRVPQQDLSAFAAAITAYSGLPRGAGVTTVLRLRACGDWLGSLLGRTEQQELWVA